MKASVVEIDLQLLGAHLANGDSKSQASFFRGLARELMTWNSNYHVQMQFHHIASELTQNEKDTLENALECLWFKEADHETNSK